MALAATAVGSAPAHAGHICQAVEPGVVAVDAMLEDWRGLDEEAPLRRGQLSADASFELRCAFDPSTLYLAVRVRDERVLRSRRARGGGEDALHLALRAGPHGGDPSRPGVALSAGRSPAGPGGWTMTYRPGTAGVRARREGGGAARADDSLRDDGWQIEVGVPLAEIPGWGSSTPLLLGEASYDDMDRSGAAPDERLLFRGSLHFSTHVPALRGFLSRARLSVPGLRLDALADIDGLPGAERVVAGGRYLAVLTDSFAFIELPLSSPADLERAELVDFDGDGRSSLLVQYRQRGGGGSREVVAVWSGAAGGGLERSLGFEVSLELGGRRIVNRWSLVPASLHRADLGASRRGGRREGAGRGKLDILVEVGPADNRGWDPASFARIRPSPDVRPILAPWSGKRAVVYYFDGEVALEAPARSSR